MDKPKVYMRLDELQCSKCWCVKTLGSFYRNNKRKTGFDNLCISCRKQTSHENNNTNRKRRWVKVQGTWFLASFKWTTAAIHAKGYPFRIQAEKPGVDE